MTTGTKKLTLIALLTALASALHAVEAVIPVPYVVPGAKLGLANVVALYAVLVLDLKSALAISFMRTLIGSLISGTFLNVGYWLASSGAIVSTLVMWVCRKSLGEALSPIALSVVGAAAHNVAQLFTAALILREPGVFYYLPYLLAFAVPTGIITGAIAGRVSSLVNHRGGKR